MKTFCRLNLYLALIHFPVKNKNGETITSAVTNLDLHDIARAARTFGVKRFYVVTPLDDQQDLTRRIISHWVEGYGAKYNPKRKEALSLISVKGEYKDAVKEISLENGMAPVTVATTAGSWDRSLGYEELREKIKQGVPYLLNFGTAWGLSSDFMAKVDYVLDPIEGPGDYNHLSVRSAVSIILDRLISPHKK